MSNTALSAPPGWAVVVDKAAQKPLDRLPADDFGHVDAASESMSVDPFSGDLEHLKNDRYGYRRRVGNYHVLFDVDKPARRVRIGGVARRTSTTYRKRTR
jgi:mRNA-degrading endonuclease RelE of RelBE toxin-antitoxin system